MFPYLYHILVEENACWEGLTKRCGSVVCTLSELSGNGYYDSGPTAALKPSKSI